jgi:ComF family protein
MIAHFFNLIYPHLCPCCEEQLSSFEPFICELCLHTLPQTNFHVQTTHPILDLLLGRCNFNHASAFLTFIKDSKVQQLLHEIKYNNRPDLATFIGTWYGSILKQDAYPVPDYIIPIPLHPKKLKTRGYNQSEAFAQGLSQEWGQNLVETQLLLKSESSESQTKKSKAERFKNVSEHFYLSPNTKNYKGKTLLVVDDVITTGATLEAAIHQLEQLEPKHINILSIAVAKS